MARDLPLPAEFAASGSRLYFKAITDETGQELFAMPIAALMDSDLDGLDYAAETRGRHRPFNLDSDDDAPTDGAEVRARNRSARSPTPTGMATSDGDRNRGRDQSARPEAVPQTIPLSGPWGFGALAALLLAIGRAARSVRAASSRDRG